MTITPNMVAFEEKVVSFQRENDEVQRVLVTGSDEHLDFLIEFKDRLKNLTNSFDRFISDIIPSSNKLTPDQIRTSGVPSLLELFSSAIKLVAALKRSRISSELQNSCKEYFIQVENLRELISDLEIHRANDDDLDLILQEINSF